MATLASEQAIPALRRRQEASGSLCVPGQDGLQGERGEEENEKPNCILPEALYPCLTQGSQTGFPGIILSLSESRIQI